jgi:hypothetical protein
MARFRNLALPFASIIPVWESLRPDPDASPSAPTGASDEPTASGRLGTSIATHPWGAGPVLLG